MSWLLRDVELGARRLDCRLRDGLVAEIGLGLERHGEELLDARGGALLPGLADHHLHVPALAAALDSVDLRGATTLDDAPDAPPSRWLRVVGAGAALARADVDRRWPHRPVRVQHRSGALWTLNSAAIEAVGAGLSPEERQTGQLWRADERLAALLAAAGERQVGDVAAVGRLLASLGVTHVTDATPDLDPETLRALPQRVLSMAAAGTGPRKIVLADHTAPDFDRLVAQVAESHAAGRAVAIHTVTATTLALSLAAFHAVGVLAGDRLEHAAICDDDAAAQIADLDVAVVTQPTIYARHREAFLRETPESERPLLWRYGSLLAAGVRVAVSSDAPYGDPDPGRTLAAAVSRPIEGVDARTVLASLLASPHAPAGPARAIAPGTAADLCLLTGTVDETLEAAVRHGRWAVRATFVDGRKII